MLSIRECSHWATFAQDTFTDSDLSVTICYIFVLLYVFTGLHSRT